jgi:hypothetical protein
MTSRLLISLALMVGVPLMVARPAPAQTTHLAVIVGLAGEPEHGELFQRWATTLVDASQKLGVTQVTYLSENPEADPKRINGKSSKEEVTKVFEKLASAGEEDVVHRADGHGRSRRRGSTRRSDLTPADPVDAGASPRHVVLVNTASERPVH